MPRTARLVPLAAALLATAAFADVKETVKLTITGGPNAGTHEGSTGG